MKVKDIIFISHRTTDKDIADMLVEFFIGVGISRDKVFCSSLPGNDVKESISKEIKNAIKESSINIAILSQEYYDSAYCLNEAGIFWYKDVPVIPIALPEINVSNMHGFLNSDYKLRRLDSDTDVSFIYDAVREAVSANQVKASIVTQENNKLRNRYVEYIKTRDTSEKTGILIKNFDISEVTTDDEKIVLYYILQKKVRKVSKAHVLQWLRENEIYDISIENAFDLLSSFEGGTVNNGVLEFSIKSFRKYSANAEQIIFALQECVNRHKKLAAVTLKASLEKGIFDSVMWLFLAYIVDERIVSFGDRWMASLEIESIKQWENKYSLDSELSSNYSRCLGFFVQNNFVYESEWTSYGNPRKYTLCISLQDFLFNCKLEILENLQEVKRQHYIEIAF